MLKQKLSVGLMLLFPIGAMAQAHGNPVADAFRRFESHHGKLLIEAAESMPADKYGFKPTDAQWSFGQIVAHIAGDDQVTCSAIAGAAPVAEPKLSASVTKDDGVAALKRSIDFCNSAIAKVTDAQLTDSVIFYGGHTMRISALVGLVEDWSDHYSQLAGYLRLNNVLPPTAKEGGS
jgi:hypothetical protein